MMLRDCADRIKSAVSMQDVAEQYGFAVDRRSRKIRCPFHDDSKPSMQVYPGSRGYYCFVCGTGGDIINFVQRTFGLSFVDACRKLNDDFQLGLIVDGPVDEVARAAAERVYQEKLKQRKKREAEKKLALTIYQAAFDRFAFLDILMEENKPTNPDEPISPDYVYACKRIDAAWQDVLDTYSALSALEKG